MRRKPLFHSVFLVLASSEVSGYTMIPRLVIQGGKTTTTGQTYTSSANSGDLIILPLNTSFSTSSPPFTLISSSGPTSAWHTLSPLTSTSHTWNILSFGGDGGADEPVQTASDSAWDFDINLDSGLTNFTQKPTAWASEPQRRIYHSSASGVNGGKVYITGGLKGDGSDQTFSQVYSYDPSSSVLTFTSLPSLPVGIYHHSSVLLPNGTLIVIGGVYLSATTGTATLLPLSALYALDTISNFMKWVPTAIGGYGPGGRRGAATVLNSAGDKLWIHGGADASLSAVYGDTWMLDLNALTWSQITNSDKSPGPRFDHKAIVANDQILIYGGHGESAPADADLYIFDHSKSSYVSSYTPSSTTPTTVNTYQSGTSIVNSATPQPTPTGSDSLATGPGAVNGQGTATSPATSNSVSPSGVLGDAGASSYPLNTAAKVGLVFGSLAGLGILVGASMFCYRRRRRQSRLAAAGSWPEGGTSSRAYTRPYGDREKGGEGLMEGSRGIYGGPGVYHDSEKVDERAGLGMGIGVGAAMGVGMGTIGNSLSNIAQKIGNRSTSGEGISYAELSEGDNGGLIRKSTRRIGSGIRLVGPRAQPTTDSQASPKWHLSTANNNRKSRLDMLSDEDSRAFQDIPEGDEGADDWVVERKERDWKSAKSLLGGHRSDDEEDVEEDGNGDQNSFVGIPIRGGPVPTPPIFTAYRDPFTDHIEDRPASYRSHRNSTLSLGGHDPLNLDDLLLPPRPANLRHSTQDTIATSQRSRLSHYSLTGSEHSEGVIQQAQLATPFSASVVSPSEVGREWEPVHRSESFLHRMTGGLLGSNPGSGRIKRGSGSGVGASIYGKELNIRDPAPLPAMWPIHSTENLPTTKQSPSHTSVPPSSYISPLSNTNHPRGLSITSLSSAKSMRDMTIIQREATDESQSATLESTPILDIGDLGTMVDFDSGNLYDASTFGGHKRHGGSGGETPGSIVFDGPAWGLRGGEEGDGDIATRSPFEDTPDLSLRSPLEATPSAIQSSPDTTPIEASLLKTSPQSKRSSTHTSSVPPSPIHLPSTAQRRPVREVVESINKKASKNPSNMSLFSPISSYSPASTAPPSPNRPTPPQGAGKLMKNQSVRKTYEAVKRSPLTVANPDKRGQSSQSSSDA